MKAVVLAVFLAVASSTWAVAAPPGSAAQVMARLRKEYAGLKDYQVGLVVRVNMPQIDMPDMPVTAYYRAPDRTALVARTFAFVPEQGVFLLPSMFGADRFTPLGMRTEGDGRDLRYHLQLQPKPGVLAKLARSTMILTSADSLLSASIPDVPVDLWVDPATWTIARVRVKIPRGPGRPGVDFDARSRYSTHSGYRLPDRSDIRMTLDDVSFDIVVPRKPGVDNRDLPQGAFPDGAAPQRATREPIRGSIVLTFTNYRVNRGVPDAVFTKRRGF